MKTRKARSLKGRNSKMRSQKAPSSSKKVARTKSSITVLKKQIERQARELEEARQQQAASSRVLRIIGGSSGTLKPVFQAIVKSAVELCGAHFGAVFKMEANLLHLVADYNFGATQRQLLGAMYPMVPNRGHISGRAVLTSAVVQIPDIYADKDYKSVEAKKAGFRSLFAAPLLQSGRAIGSIVIYKTTPGAFTAQQLASLQDFAAQAVIAIENARLFEEVQERTRDLSEALTYQTGSANILTVIASSPTDVKPVLKAIVESACELCEAYDAAVVLQDGEHLRFSAHHGPIPIGIEKWPISRQWVSGRAFIDQMAVHIHDLRDEAHTDLPDGRELALRMGHRTILAVPLLREGTSIGAIVLRRTEVHPFTEKQVALLKTFADQAVIAIENVRLFNETQDALERQTATADVLKVIASSPSNLQPVFDAIAERSNRLVGGHSTTVQRFVGDRAELAAFTPTTAEGDAALKASFPRLLKDYPLIDLAYDGESAVVADTETETRIPESVKLLARSRGFRSMLLTPLVGDGGPTGLISVTRKEPGSFAPHHVGLLRTFADQAVIAIQNVRMFDEVQARTRELQESLQQQTATAEVLQIISSSPSDLAPVFDTMLENATRVCGAEFGSMNLLEGDMLRQVALYNAPSAFSAKRVGKAFRIHPRSSLADAIHSKQVVQVDDMRKHPAYLERNPSSVELTELAGARTIVVVPMLQKNEVIGLITVYRQEVRPFSDKQIELLTNFSRQVVIAIENARLLGELRQRTNDLSKSLDDLRTAQDRLVQTEKLASLGQLTAGIAHEIKNPLNFINNFAALSAELIDEMTEVLENPRLDESGRRRELDDMRELLKSNLEKVVQHGKRADSIVKNMLLHSRQEAGENRPVEINALVDESLNLAYHGARAEKTDFNIALERDFDASAGPADVYPQEITRVLLNVISNGFYAATKRASQVGGGFEPRLSAATKDLGDKVEIRIRDNGSGIPSEVKDKIFNPFFTTKPAGEGTGLGLSISHDIVVKQHGGTIEVATEVGAFTEFRIVLPRTGTLTRSGEQV